MSRNDQATLRALRKYLELRADIWDLERARDVFIMTHVGEDDPEEHVDVLRIEERLMHLNTAEHELHHILQGWRRGEDVVMSKLAAR